MSFESVKAKVFQIDVSVINVRSIVHAKHQIIHILVVNHNFIFYNHTSNELVRNIHTGGVHIVPQDQMAVYSIIFDAISFVSRTSKSPLSSVKGFPN